MKKLLVLACAAIFCFCMCKNDPNAYNVKLVSKVKSEKSDWSKLYLFSMEKGKVLTTAERKNDTYNFKGTDSLPELVTISTDSLGRNPLISFVLDHQATEFTLDSMFTTNRVYSLQGSEINNKLKTVRDSLVSCTMKQNKLQDYARNLAMKNKGSLPDSAKERLQSLWVKENATQLRILDNAVLSNRDNLISVLLLVRYSDFVSPNVLDSVLTKNKYQKLSLLKPVFEEYTAFTRRKAGVKFTNFSMQNPEGKTQSLSDFVGQKGHYLLVDFWASWCGPCRAFIPTLKELYKKFHSKGLDVLGVSLDSDKEAWVGAIKKFKLPWAQLSDLKGWNNAAARLYGIRAIPATLLISPEGKIVAYNIPHEELEAKIKSLLKKK